MQLGVAFDVDGIVRAFLLQQVEQSLVFPRRV
jgi:hypothetical protein